MTPDDRWHHRRRMAYAALVCGLAYPLLILATDSPQLGQIAPAYYGFVGAIMAAYIGFATWDDVAHKGAA